MVFLQYLCRKLLLSMLNSHIGEIAALGVSVCWTLSALFFEKAGHKISSLSVNFIRLLLAIGFLGITTLITRGIFFPTDATGYQWFWLGLSGFVGFFLGDQEGIGASRGQAQGDGLDGLAEGFGVRRQCLPVIGRAHGLE